METTVTNKVLAADIAELMRGWNTIKAAAITHFPNATADEIYKITANAMNHALRLSTT